MKRKLALFVFAVVLVTGLSGQSRGDDGFAVQISALSLDSNIQGLKIISGEAVEEIDIYTTTRSRVIRYQGPARLTFFRETADSQGTLVRTPVGSVVLEAGRGRHLLFFMRKPGSLEEYSITALPDDLENFRLGSFRFVNLTSHPVGVRIGEERLLIEERGFGDVRGDFENGNHYRAILVSAPADREPFVSYSGRVYFSERLRMIYLIFPDESEGSGAIRFRAIRDSSVR